MNATHTRHRPLAARFAGLLRAQGYCVIPAACPKRQIGALDDELAERFALTPFCEGLFSGRSTKRFHGLLKRSRGAAALVTHDLVLAVTEEILRPFCDTVQLNLTQAIEIHPGAGAQCPHRDQDMWQGDKGRIEYLVNVMWPLTPFTPENGGTMIWPQSHIRQDEKAMPADAAVSPRLEPGDAMLFLGSTLHGAGANASAHCRRGIIVSYCLGWLKPYENMWLTYPPDIAGAFPPRLQQLVGYRLNRPNLGNVDGNCPSLLLAGDPPPYLPTRDSFLPAQLEALARHAAGAGAGAVAVGAAA